MVVADKSGGKFRELHTIGVSSDPQEIEKLVSRGHNWIDKRLGRMRLDFEGEEAKETEVKTTQEVIDNIESVLLNGVKLIIDKVYDSIGFNQIEDVELRQLVVGRLCQPMSKLATVEYLKTHFEEDAELTRIYRYLDKLYNTQQELVQRISVEHTFGVLGGCVEMLFYDVTSLYFESFREDGLRSPGFSKDGKTSETQVILGLLVCEDGYPLSYSLFNGGQYEGYTMIPVIDDFKQRFHIEDFVVVADCGFMTSRNIELLRQAGYKFIVGARIKKYSGKVKEWLLSLPHEHGEYHEHKLDNGDRLIVTYSQKRADKDKFNREKGIQRLKKNFASGKVTKDKINKRGYNKFLKLENDVKVSIDQDKIDEDAKWDGLKGYFTNTDLEPSVIVNQYKGLWVVERAFRITKGQLETRPIFHFTERRIETHVCCCFIAYKVYKELERIIKMLGMSLSVDKVIKIAKTITSVRFRLPKNDSTITKIIMVSEEQKRLKPLFDYLGILG